MGITGYVLLTLLAVLSVYFATIYNNLVSLKHTHGHEELVERFDSDGDGRVDMEEWDHARREAEAIVEDHVAKAAMKPDVDVLMKSEEDRPFIPSTKSQDELTQVYRWKATGGLILFAAGFVALGVTLTARFGPIP